MAREIPSTAAVNEAIALEMARDETVLFYGQDVAPSDDDELVKSFGRDRVRVSPISETAEIGMARGAAPALHERRPGQGAGRVQGRIRVHRRMGRSAHGLALRHVHGHSRPEGR